MRGEGINKDRHHMLEPRVEYKTRHEKKVRGLLILEVDVALHSLYNSEIARGIRQVPTKPDHNITLCLLDYLEEKDPEPFYRPLYAIDRLNKLRSEEALALADNFVSQLGFFGIEYGV